MGTIKPLSCDCYSGCWRAHSADWPKIEFANQEELQKTIRACWESLRLPYGSYVSTRCELRLQTEEYKQRVECLLNKEREGESMAGEDDSRELEQKAFQAMSVKAHEELRLCRDRLDAVSNKAVEAGRLLEALSVKLLEVAEITGVLAFDSREHARSDRRDRAQTDAGRMTVDEVARFAAEQVSEPVRLIADHDRTGYALRVAAEQAFALLGLDLVAEAPAPREHRLRVYRHLYDALYEIATAASS
jgi:hypothetical protein